MQIVSEKKNEKKKKHYSFPYHQALGSHKRVQNRLHILSSMRYHHRLLQQTIYPYLIVRYVFSRFFFCTCVMPIVSLLVSWTFAHPSITQTIHSRPQVFPVNVKLKYRTNLGGRAAHNTAIAIPILLHSCQQPPTQKRKKKYEPQT